MSQEDNRRDVVGRSFSNPVPIDIVESWLKGEYLVGQSDAAGYDYIGWSLMIRGLYGYVVICDLHENNVDENLKGKLGKMVFKDEKQNDVVIGHAGIGSIDIKDGELVYQGVRLYTNPTMYSGQSREGRLQEELENLLNLSGPKTESKRRFINSLEDKLKRVTQCMTDKWNCMLEKLKSDYANKADTFKACEGKHNSEMGQPKEELNSTRVKLQGQWFTDRSKLETLWQNDLDESLKTVVREQREDSDSVSYKNVVEDLKGKKLDRLRRLVDARSLSEPLFWRSMFSKLTRVNKDKDPHVYFGSVLYEPYGEWAYRKTQLDLQRDISEKWMAPQNKSITFEIENMAVCMLLKHWKKQMKLILEKNGQWDEETKSLMFEDDAYFPGCLGQDPQLYASFCVEAASYLNRELAEQLTAVVSGAADDKADDVGALIHFNLDNWRNGERKGDFQTVSINGGLLPANAGTIWWFPLGAQS